MVALGGHVFSAWETGGADQMPSFRRTLNPLDAAELSVERSTEIGGFKSQLWAYRVCASPPCLLLL